MADAFGSLKTVAAYGTGPVDAAFKAVDMIVDVENDLQEFSVQSVSRGIDALGEVTVRLAAGEVFIGRGSDNDIIVSSAKAYINALNRLLSVHAERNK